MVGAPDAKYGEELCACVQVRSGAHLTTEEIRDFCRGRIALFKIPKHAYFVRFTIDPRHAAGCCRYLNNIIERGHRAIKCRCGNQSKTMV